MTTIDDFETVLRSYIGTPFHHAGRVPGLHGGLDCGGMVVAAMKELGMPVVDQASYSLGDGISQLKDTLQANCIYKRPDDIIEPGDLLLLRARLMYHHLVYWTKDGTIIHAWQTTGINKVVESNMLPAWWDSIESIWRIKDLEPWQQ